MTRRSPLVAILLACCLVAACDAAPETAPSAPADAAGTTTTVALGDRPFKLHLPASYDARTKIPLVVALHGYTGNAEEQESYFKFVAEADRRGFLHAMPDGTRNSRFFRFWNATDACCDTERTGTDDAGYLRRLIDAVKAAHPVDPGRIYLVGHSNGAFMAYRMACDHADTVTAIVSLAGAVAQDPAGCAPARPVGVLHIHGTADDSIKYEGGVREDRAYPSAAAGVDRWRRYNGCTDRVAPAAAALDLDLAVPGAETTVTAYRDGCRAGGQVTLWTVKDGDHVPVLSPTFVPSVLDHLFAQTR